MIIDHDTNREPVMTPWPPPPGEWARHGRCRGLGEAAALVFFPERGGDTAAAKAICAECPVMLACREYAVPHPGLVGIWGGTSSRQRREMRARGAVA